MRFVARPLSPEDLDLALLTACLQSDSQIYLKNRIVEERARTAAGQGELAEGDFFGVFSSHGLELLAWFDRGGALVLSAGDPDAVMPLRKLCLHTYRGLRVLIGSGGPVRRLSELIGKRAERPLFRSQPFLLVDSKESLGESCEVRLAQPEDMTWLLEANLKLNDEDLGVDPNRVDRVLLEARILGRMDKQCTWVHEAGGRPLSKLDIGSRGPYGVLIEGVFTEHASRGVGHAKRLVAGVSDMLLDNYPRVGLHVGRNNEPAIRAYATAGFREIEDFWLVRLEWNG
jgi:GNAT superfamily N-acetyltransferase